MKSMAQLQYLHPLSVEVSFRKGFWVANRWPHWSSADGIGMADTLVEVIDFVQKTSLCSQMHFGFLLERLYPDQGYKKQVGQSVGYIV